MIILHKSSTKEAILYKCQFRCKMWIAYWQFASESSKYSKNEHRNVLLKKKNKSRKIWLLTYIITSNGTYKNWKIDFYICHLHWGFRHDFNRCYMTSNIIYYYIQRRHSFNSWWFFEIFTITQASIVYKDTWLDNKYVKRKIIFCLNENHHGKYMIDFAYCNYKTITSAFLPYQK